MSSPADLPVAAPDPAAELQRAKEWVRDYDNVTVEHEAGEIILRLLAERQQDKERIERLETALLRITETDSTEWHETHGWQAFDFIQRIAAAALAVEEDAPE